MRKKIRFFHFRDKTKHGDLGDEKSRIAHRNNKEKEK